MDTGYVSYWVMRDCRVARGIPIEKGAPPLDWVAHIGESEGVEVVAVPLAGPFATQEEAERVVANRRGRHPYTSAYVMGRSDPERVDTSAQAITPATLAASA